VKSDSRIKEQILTIYGKQETVWEYIVQDKDLFNLLAAEFKKLNSSSNTGIMSLKNELSELQRKQEKLLTGANFCVIIVIIVENPQKTSTPLDENFLLDISKLAVFKDKLLGKGSFGKVYEGSYFKLPVAVKKLKTSNTESALDDFRREVRILMY
jgi:hypothetical protein